MIDFRNVCKACNRLPALRAMSLPIGERESFGPRGW
jgi:hypothetical protein